MKTNVLNFLRAAFPFLAVLVLWRLSTPFWNPGGILAIIPIFFCSFVRPVPWFAPFSAIFCFLIDYNFDTMFFWTVMYCLFYAANGFQNFIDLTRLDRNAINIFMMFFGISVFILMLAHPNWTTIMRAIWLFAWTSALYYPITALVREVHDD